MNTLEIIGACLGIPLAFLGLLGGLLSFREAFIKWRLEKAQAWAKRRRVHLPRPRRQGGLSEFHFLAAGDLYQIIFPLVRDTSARITSIRQIGEYYEFKAECDSSTDSSMIVTKRESNKTKR